MASDKPVKLAILWHMHQPNYQKSGSRNFILPWVRLHAIKDYLDMPLMAAKYDKVKINFNLVPALIDQLQAYLDGADDPHLRLSRLKVESLSEAQKREIVETFFMAPLKTMIQPYDRYYELYLKKKNNYNHKVLPALFSSEEIRDIQVWSNLVWVDPIFRDEPVIKQLFDKRRHFTNDDKDRLLEWQMELIGRIIPTYRDLYQKGRIDLSFTPYYHPILPLLCDTETAKEALPNIELPQQRFKHPEDADWQVKASTDKFRELFGDELLGMWPSEGSVSEEAVDIISNHKIKWIATDEEVLFNSLKKTGLSSQTYHKYQPYKFKDVNIFFRDHALSDRVGFIYSSMPPEKAVMDFVEHIYRIRDAHRNELDNIVIPVILDGENAWEYFKNDGYEFLDLLYKRLHDDELIETVFFKDAALAMNPPELPALFAGSWINHNFKIWIGHSEDNAAWDLLTEARNEVVKFQTDNPEYEPLKLKKAWEKIYIAEGSDWCWWYGEEHRGLQNKEFDEIFRSHLKEAYLWLELIPPKQLDQPIYHDDVDFKMSHPEQLITPVIDGRLSHFYEWSGAGRIDCLKSGGAMHRVDRFIDYLYFAYDHKCLYIRLDLDMKKILESKHKAVCRLSFKTPQEKTVECSLTEKGNFEHPSFGYAVDNILEVSILRSFLFEEGFGKAEFEINLIENDTVLENCPGIAKISINIPPKAQELFWPS